MAADSANLERVQRWFHAAITHPGGMREGLASDIAQQFIPTVNSGVDDIVLPSDALSSTERLSIYANMYFDRLADILAEEFPSVRHLLGRQVFADVVSDYVTRHPSTHYSLARLGEEFPLYLAHEGALPAPELRAFASAVASVERTMEDVFDERQDEPLSHEKIRSIDPDDWHRVRLKTISALRLLELEFPVNGYISAVRDGRSADVAAPKHSFVIVYRRDYQVWRTDLEQPQFTLLSELHRGQTLADAFAATAESSGRGPASLATSVFEWFRIWAAEGYFRSIDIVD